MAAINNLQIPLSKLSAKLARTTLEETSSTENRMFYFPRPLHADV